MKLNETETRALMQQQPAQNPLRRSSAASTTNRGSDVPRMRSVVQVVAPPTSGLDAALGSWGGCLRVVVVLHRCGRCLGCWLVCSQPRWWCDLRRRCRLFTPVSRVIHCAHLCAFFFVFLFFWFAESTRMEMQKHQQRIAQQRRLLEIQRRRRQRQRRVQEERLEAIHAQSRARS